MRHLLVACMHVRHGMLNLNGSVPPQLAHTQTSSGLNIHFQTSHSSYILAANLKQNISITLLWFSEKLTCLHLGLKVHFHANLKQNISITPINIIRNSPVCILPPSLPQVGSVLQTEGDKPVKFSSEVVFTPEKFEIVWCWNQRYKSLQSILSICMYICTLCLRQSYSCIWHSN